VLTNLEAKWTFGFCRLAPNSETALVFLSYLPWHELFYKLLNQCAELTQSSDSGQIYIYSSRFKTGIFTAEFRWYRYLRSHSVRFFKFEFSKSTGTIITRDLSFLCNTGTGTVPVLLSFVIYGTGTLSVLMKYPAGFFLY
jgi:hypothetical protein